MALCSGFDKNFISRELREKDGDRYSLVGNMRVKYIYYEEVYFQGTYRSYVVLSPTISVPYSVVPLDVVVSFVCYPWFL